MTKFSRGLNLVSGLNAPLVGKTFFLNMIFLLQKICFCIFSIAIVSWVCFAAK